MLSERVPMDGVTQGAAARPAACIRKDRKAGTRGSGPEINRGLRKDRSYEEDICIHLAVSHQPGGADVCTE